MNKYLQVLFCFFKLGLISFGGPAAHIGYFQNKFVTELKWLSQQEFSMLLSLSQFLPGPGSSQIGFAIGFKRAGHVGALLAFIGFTLPSFILMYGLAVLTSLNTDAVLFNAIVYGLKLLAVVVVADAIMTMFGAFCKHTSTRFIAMLSALILIFYPSLGTQMFVLLIGAGLAIAINFSVLNENTAVSQVSASIDPLKNTKTNHTRTKTIRVMPLFLFLVLFVGLPFVSSSHYLVELFSIFFHSGSLVFGGGHVVLPLLQEGLQGAISADHFITGYAFAQAVPGPMFTLATFLGANIFDSQPLLGALIATVAIFLPGFLLILALEKTWQSLLHKPLIASAVVGVNASVVGLLISAFYRPVFESSVHNFIDLLIVILGFYLLKHKKLAIGKLVLIFAFYGGVLSLFG